MRPNALVAVVLSLVVHAFSSSQAPRPLKRIDHPATLDFEEHSLPSTLNKRRSVSSSRSPARLTVRAFDSTYHIHLSPNDLLLHPQARINYYSPAGEIVRSEPFTQDDAGLRVYEGVVVKPEATDRRWKEDRIGGVMEGGAVDRKDEELGWARITVKDDGRTYEGAFTVKGVGVHHIQTTSNYMRHRHDVEPHPDPDAENGHIVIFRDGDRHGAESSTSEQPQSCSHDDLRYNTDPSLNKVLDPFSYLSEHSTPPWYDPRITDLSAYDSMDLDARFVPSSNPSHNKLAKRQNNDISGGGNMSSNFVNSIGSKTGCPTSQSIVYLGVAADCRYVQFYGGSANATTQILNDFNTATSLYKSTFSISLGIVELAVMDET
ncbi:hypothetical protein FRB96_005287 [Tulasnella sp. 330]|nr:hypothetical protein FRB96_005287 [Tulasnella sp. 330]KAG8870554.1 hypothetical protein FRB98_001550 [Tulasnella sp. 332]